MRRITIIFFIAPLLWIQASCDRPSEQAHYMDYTDAQEQLIEANRDRVRAERDEIDAFIARKGWPVDTSGTGLRYWVFHEGGGAQAQPGMYAELDYSISLLNDSVMYTSETHGRLSFNIGQDFVETGLHEAMLYLHMGDSARLVLPSHLAHGLTGDFGRIPGNSPVVYELFVHRLQ